LIKINKYILISRVYYFITEFDLRKMVAPTEIKFEVEWSNIQQGFTKLIRMIEGESEPAFNQEIMMMMHTCVGRLM